MVRHGLILLYRNFKRFKTAFIINLMGLSSGLACTLLIYLWVADELSIDKFHPNHERLFQVMTNETGDKGVTTNGYTQPALAATLADEMPEVEYATVATPPAFFPTFTVIADDHRVKGVGKFASKDFFSVFQYPIVEGTTGNLLANQNAIVISERLARNLFNTTQNLIGKPLEWQLLDLKKSVVISGVFKDVPSGVSEQFDFILSFDSFRAIMGTNDDKPDWNNSAPFRTYLLAHEGIATESFNNKINTFLQKRNVQSRQLFLKNYSDGYLYGEYENGVESGGRIVYVKLFSIIALFTLLIACVNFMNLSTAKASRRLKEVGIKKAIGATKKNLIFQFLGESLLLTFLSLFLAVVTAECLLPQFSEITQKHLVIHFDLKFILSSLGIAALTGLIAGSYPAFYLSGFSPAHVLKGIIHASWGELLARRGLVIFQFTVSVVFIVSVMVVFKQLEFIQARNPGYNKDNILYFETDSRLSQDVDAFLQEVRSIPGVLNASSMLGNIISETEGGGMPGSIVRNGKTIVINSSSVNFDMVETLGITLKEGRSFARAADPDTMKVIYNEAAIEALELRDPIGKRIDNLEIIGVVRNFHFQSLHEEVKPYSFRLEPHYATTIMVKVKSGVEAEAIAELKQLNAKFSPGYAMDFKFLDQTYQAQYISERIVGSLSKYFAGLAVMISCLGLFGLAAFSAERRLKEISIRKILGSSELGIVYRLSAEFAQIVFVAIIIALPMGFVIARQWLDTFAYKVNLELWYFTAAGLSAMVIAMLTVAIQTIKAARVNPTEYLKSE